jgi:hypothetical protein
MDQDRDDYADSDDSRTASPLVVLAIVGALALVTGFVLLFVLGWFLKTHLGPPD